jgi:hypothetical protein
MMIGSIVVNGVLVALIHELGGSWGGPLTGFLSSLGRESPPLTGLGSEDLK